MVSESINDLRRVFQAVSDFSHTGFTGPQLWAVKVIDSPDVASSMLVKGLEKIPDDKLVRIHEGMAEFVKILGVEGAAPRLILSNEVNIQS